MYTAGDIDLVASDDEEVKILTDVLSGDDSYRISREAKAMAESDAEYKKLKQAGENRIREAKLYAHRLKRGAEHFGADYMREICGIADFFYNTDLESIFIEEAVDTAEELMGVVLIAAYLIGIDLKKSDIEQYFEC